MPLTETSSVRCIAVIGCGTIGASWAAYFLARGFEVQAWDPAPDGEVRLRAFVDSARPALDRLGFVQAEASPVRLTFHASPAAALEGCDFVQESAPEDEAVKRELYRQFDEALPDGVVMSSSTSGLVMSRLQAGRRGSERYVVGHPFNPPHLIPLVEVVGGKETDPAAVDWAIDFYSAIGKKPVRLNREAPGHLVNRLQAALWREAMDAVLSGLASVEDVDTAIKYGPGLRWGVMGPFELCYLAGGSGGFDHFIDHFGDAMQAWWSDMRDVDLTPEVRAQLKQAVAAGMGGRDHAAIERERDTLLLAMMQTLAQTRWDEGYE